jgi:hypothetical protein
MRCRLCGRKLRDPTSLLRKCGPICVKKIKLSEQIELSFDDLPEVVEQQEEQKKCESLPAKRKFAYKIQLGLNFEPVIKPDMSALDKHEAVNKILNL